MKAWAVTSVGFGRQIFLAGTAEDAIAAYHQHVARCEKNNGEEFPSTDKTITAVRTLGMVVNINK